jgi:hypothetical protein
MMSEKDYAAIEEAVLSTARGRWFLAEYARRIRAAETDRILLALAEISRRVDRTQTPPPHQTGSLPNPATHPFALALADIEALPLTERLKLTG